jgi:serine protease
MKRFLFASLSASLLAACTAADLSEGPGNGPRPLSREQIDAIILDQLETQGEFQWNDADDLTLWSAVVHGDYMVSVGYHEQPAAAVARQEVQALTALDVRASALDETRDQLLRFIARDLARTTDKAQPSAEELLVFEEDVLPVVDVEIDSYDTLMALRRHPNVRYVEPLGYVTEAERQKSDAGCSNDAEPSIPAEDFGTVSPDAKVPWNFFEMNIPDAWSMSTGRGITVALIDSGVSAGQARLGSEFASGDSTGRFIEKAGTFRPDSDGPADGPDDDCGHGTLMAGTIAAPRSTGGAIAGVAHGANLLAIRATDDVVLNSANEKKGVADALVLAADRADVKVISMSLGHIFSSSRIADAVRYAHARGKLMFVAAGTSTTFTNWVGVTFPASMDEVVAVTGIETGDELVRCDVCHSGSAVDFVVVMQRAEDSSRTSLSLAMSGNTPGYVGGSSTATATMAGVAALVWARNPSLSRDQVLQILRESSSLYPGRDRSLGFGTVDAALAVSLAQ